MHKLVLPEGYTATDQTLVIEQFAPKLAQLKLETHRSIAGVDLAQLEEERELRVGFGWATEVGVFHEGRERRQLVGYGMIDYERVKRGLRGDLCWLTVHPDHRGLGLARYIIALRVNQLDADRRVVCAAVPELSEENKLESYYRELGFRDDPTQRFALIRDKPPKPTILSRLRLLRNGAV